MIRTDFLYRIERTNLLLGVAVVALAGLVWRLDGMIAAAIGAALACANFTVLRRLGARAVEQLHTRTDGRQAGRLVAALMTKMLLLFALVGFAVAVLRVQLAPLALGLSVYLVSILLTAFLAVVGRAEEVT